MKLLVCFLAAIVVGFAAPAFKPGDRVEYKAYGKWEPGVVESELPGGKQLIIRRKPSEFYPKGDTAAYSPEELRAPGAASAPAAGTTAPAAVPNSTAPSVKPSAAQPLPVPAPGKAPGLLSKEAVIAYARQAMGNDPWGNPNRQAVLNQIRDYIKANGTSFTADSDFETRMNLQGTMSSHIGWAVNLHRGAAPRVSDYFGRWALTAANRGSHSYSKESGGRVKVTTTDSQVKSGALEIHADGTYLWKMGPSDPPAQWLRGVWHESKPEEMNP